MKPLRYLIVTIAVLCATPAAIGIVDAWAWLVVGEQISWMDWSTGRRMMAWFFLFLAAGAAIAGFEMRDAADR